MRLLVVLLLSFVAFSLAGLQWGPCPFNSTVAGVQCVNASVPQDWNYPSSWEKFYIVAAKIPTTAPNRVGTVWFLNGGSGVGGRCMGQSPPTWVQYYTKLGFDMVFPTFRGAGDSQPQLLCPDDPENLRIPSIRCANYLNATFGSEYMSYFSLAQASHDLHYLIEQLAEPPTYLQGDSFGTWWGQTYLAIYPFQVDAVGIESFVVPDKSDFFKYSLDWAGRRALTYCSNDPFCNAHAGQGEDPVAALEDITESVATKSLPCLQRLPQYLAPDGDWPNTFRTLFGALPGSAVREANALIASLLYRVRRCSKEDVQAIVHLWDYITSSMPAKSSTHGYEDDPCALSQVAFYNAAMSEGIQNPPPPTFEALKDKLGRQMFGPPLSIVAHTRALYDAWPKYNWDSYVHKFPNISIPLLTFNGDLDISAPWANAAYTSLVYNKPQQHLYRFPMIPHVALLTSPVFGSRVPCGLEIMTKWFLSGGKSVDSSCISNLKPLDWFASEAKSKEVSKQFFGTEDPWELS